MFDKWLGLPAHYYLRITALLILVVGIAVSNVLMSIGAIWIISNWLIEADFPNYGKRLARTPELWLILGMLGLHVLSLAWSDDFWFGFKDIRIKLPLLAIPLALGSGRPVESRVFFFILYAFLGITALTSIYNFIRYNLFADPTTDIRQMSVFISQIRFATLVDLAIFTSVFLVLRRKMRLLWALPLMAWLVFYTYKAQVLNGYLLLVLLTVFTLFYGIVRLRTAKLKVLLVVMVAIMAIIPAFIIYKAVESYHGLDKPDIAQLDQFTANGNPYYHDTTLVQTENGHYVWLYMCQEELENEWNKRSEIAYDSVDQKGQPLFGTLMRYMTSKNLRKDSAGVWQLSDEEIGLVEKGTTSIASNQGLKARVHSFLFEYDMYMGGADPNGFSLLQRIEHLKTAKLILEDYWLTGVGIGDLELVFQDYYNRSGSQLLPENRLRAHNQFISLWIALGLPGLVILLLLFVVPLWRRRQGDYFLSIVMIALFSSLLFEDMLETQAGVTIFALFYSLAVFRERDPETTS